MAVRNLMHMTPHSWQYRITVDQATQRITLMLVRDSDGFTLTIDLTAPQAMDMAALLTRAADAGGPG